MSTWNVLRHDRSRRSRVWALLLACVAAVIALSSASPPAAEAAPAAPQALYPDLKQLPGQLRMYQPDTPEWAGARWMTSSACADRGGDFSMWAASAITDAPELLKFFDATRFGDDADKKWRAQADAILAGLRSLGEEFAPKIPAGYCVDDMLRWNGADEAQKPFGFSWGDPATRRALGTPFQCVDSPATRAAMDATRNQYLGAERVACDGFHMACPSASGPYRDRCGAINDVSYAYTRAVKAMWTMAKYDHPTDGVGEAIEDEWDEASSVVSGWFAELALSIGEGAVIMLAESMSFWVRADRSYMLTSPAIAEIQDQLRYVGIALLVGSTIWQGILMVYRRKPDPLVKTATGVLTFVGWSTLGGTIAVMLNEASSALANQVLNEAIKGFSERMGGAMLATLPTSVALVFFLSIILFLLSCVHWVLGFFRMGSLIILLALLPTAAAGQLNDATKPWLRKVLSWCLALILYNAIAAINFSIGFSMMGSGDDLATVLVGLAMLFTAVLSMAALMRFFDWGGQQLVSGGGGSRGGAAALGAAATMFGGGGAGAAAGGLGRFMDFTGPASQAGGSTNSGAPPVSSAHAGDGPGKGRGGPAGPGANPSPSGSPEPGMNLGRVTGAGTGAKPTEATAGSAAKASSAAAGVGAATPAGAAAAGVGAAARAASAAGAPSGAPPGSEGGPSGAPTPSPAPAPSPGPAPGPGPAPASGSPSGTPAATGGAPPPPPPAGGPRPSGATGAVDGGAGR